MRETLRRAIAVTIVTALSAGVIVAPARSIGATAPEPRDQKLPESLRPVMPLGAEVPLPALDKLALRFEPNVGQSGSDVQYFTRLGAHRLSLTERGAILDLRAPNLRPKVTPRQLGRKFPSTTEKSVARLKGARELAEKGIVRMHFRGGLPARPIAEQKLPGVVHYYVGKDPKHWRTDVPTFAQVRYPNVYPGIDVVYYGNHGALEYDVVVAPGADPRQIRVAFEGVEKKQIASNGDLMLTVDGRTIRQRKPEVYQEIAGVRRPVAGRYVVAANGDVGFEVGRYVASLPLVIDPTFVSIGNGNVGVSEKAVGDPSGNTYVTGVTASTLPVPAPAPCDEFPDIAVDAFVVKLDAQNTVLWTAILGGRANGFNDCTATFGLNLALDATAANVVAVGQTSSSNLVITDGLNVSGTPAAFQAALADNPLFVNDPSNPFYQSGGDGWVIKLTSDGGLSYATYIGGSGHDFAQAVTVDSAGNAYVTGGTQPEPDGFHFPGAYSAILSTTESGGGFSDVFVAKVNPTGSVVSFMTIQGSSGDDAGIAIALSSQGEAVITADTLSTCLDPNCLPVVTELIPQDMRRELEVAALSPIESVPGLRLRGIEAGLQAAQCPLTGGVQFKPSDYKSHSTALLAGTYNSLCDPQNAVIAKFSTTTGAKTTPPYLVGGSNEDSAIGVGVDQANTVYVAGQTTSHDMLSVNEITSPGKGADHKGKRNAFVMKLTLPPATQPTAPPVTQYSSTLGGSDTTTLSGMAVTPGGTVYLSGVTTSTDAAVIPPATTTSVVAVTDENGNPVVDPQTNQVVTQVVSNPQAFIIQIPPPPTGTTDNVVTTSDQLLSSPVSNAVAVDASALAAVAADGVTVTLTNATTDGLVPGASFQSDTTGQLVAIASIIDSTHFRLAFAYPGAPIAPQAYAISQLTSPPAMTITADVDGNVVVAGAPQDGGSLGVKITATISPTIDIKPKAKKNNINLSTKYVQVAILSTSTFDAPARVLPSSLTFGKTGNEASFVKCDKKGRKVNKDKILDLVCTFAVGATHFTATDTLGTLKGKTRAGADLIGTDAISVVPAKKNAKAKDFDDDDSTWTDADDN